MTIVQISETGLHAAFVTESEAEWLHNSPSEVLKQEFEDCMRKYLNPGDMPVAIAQELRHRDKADYRTWIAAWRGKS